ncbi:vitamin H transporter [Colletotrichum musicola]|uniref:Vitamin H transporter n=1 Tax=Colletotrichum musicola TaxID=2175873 RepID=A0A8H6JTQ5_9PEZI|nr:vitamin H transporter [Colletotrichum musicola]
MAGAITGSTKDAWEMSKRRRLCLTEGVCTIGFVVGINFVFVPESTGEVTLDERQPPKTALVDRRTYLEHEWYIKNFRGLAKSDRKAK